MFITLTAYKDGVVRIRKESIAAYHNVNGNRTYVELISGVGFYIRESMEQIDKLLSGDSTDTDTNINSNTTERNREV